MDRIRAALVTVVIAATAAACGGSSSTPLSSPSAAAPLSSQPSAPSAASESLPASAVVAASPVGVQLISLAEWKVVVASTMTSGKTDFTIMNTGVAPHELLVFKSELDPAAYPTDAAGDIVEEGGGVTLVSDGENIDPGASQARTVDLAPGKYVFVCNIPTHFKQGMFAVVTVTP